MLGDALVAPMVLAVDGQAMEGHLALWHGPGAPFLLSLATFALGAALYLGLDRIRDGLAAAEPSLPRTEAWYDAALRGLAALARGLIGAVQNGRMTSYLRVTFLALALLTWGALLLGTARWPRPALPRELIAWAIVAIILASIVVVLRTPSRLTAEAPNREERARLLAAVTKHGFIDDYSGIRISKTGRRFRIAQATVWNLLDEKGNYAGQAAMFSRWEFL